MAKKKNVLKEDEEDGSNTKQVSRSDFPPDFVFGVSTASYQIEGGINEGGRGASIWDVFAHTPGKIIDGSNADVAVDHYHRYKEDVDLISELGFDAYRFSIAWPRIFPDGLGTKVNEEGIAFYNNLIDALLEKGIEPYVTLHHWDLPLHLHESMGGWLNKKIVVKNWTTINEPMHIAVGGYDTGKSAPGRSENPSTETYLAAHHMILAHAAAVSVYHSKYKDKQGGQIGLVVDCEWAEANSDKLEDKYAAIRRVEFQLGWFLHPLYFGDYPKSMHERLGDKLPEFTEEDKELLESCMDFVGLNQYTSRLVSHATDSAEEAHFDRTQQIHKIVEWEDGGMIGEKAASEWLYVVPWGMRKVLNYIADTYSNPPIYILENGMDDEENEATPLHEMLDDKMRIGFYKGYTAAVSQAIKDGVDVRGYFAWSLMDNFEWSHGYTKRFGLVYVDYKNGLTRHPKSSAIWFKHFLKGE
ncbi:Glycoside hydrolase, family 1 [Corchorus olitorius]|uniref:Glycoside hydrolase, family 1 n=1 Tax=Corchorus olitorius TaxID=93759 RepID=A0A1R3HM81_9ROSI|nr:Glycoside hydrolase, family 1 [Corchorus olitorius]